MLCPTWPRNYRRRDGRMKEDSELAPKNASPQNIFRGESGHALLAKGGKVAGLAQDLLRQNNDFEIKELVQLLVCYKEHILKFAYKVQITISRQLTNQFKSFGTFIWPHYNSSRL